MSEIEEKFEMVLGHYERWTKRNLTDGEKKMAMHFYLQGISTTRLFPGIFK